MNERGLQAEPTKLVGEEGNETAAAEWILRS